MGHSQEGEQCLLEPSLVKLSREQSVSLADAVLSQRPDDDSPSLPCSSPLEVEDGRSLFRGIFKLPGRPYSFMTNLNFGLENPHLKP